jgi:hypothetical protein
MIPIERNCWIVEYLIPGEKFGTQTFQIITHELPNHEQIWTAAEKIGLTDGWEFISLKPSEMKTMGFLE